MRAHGGLHGRYINVDRKEERRRWAKIFNVDESLLCDAVEAVGAAVEDVRVYLELKTLQAAGRRPARRATPSR